MWTNKMFYLLKPVIPRWIQIRSRRMMVHRKLQYCLDTWPIDKRAASRPAGWSGWPEGKTFALVLTHDVETGNGQEKCRDLIAMEENMGFRSSFNFVPRRYPVSSELRRYLTNYGFEVGVHGLYHDGKYYDSRTVFRERAKEINGYLKEWNAVGFRSPSMLSKLEWFHDLDVEYDSSTFDTDPFEPQPHGAGTIFPFWVPGPDLHHRGYVELPYTLPQDFTVFVLMNEKTIDIWKKKLDWIAENGGMALVNTHPDYMNFKTTESGPEEYPAQYYWEFLNYVNEKYKERCWHVLPKEVARFLRDTVKTQVTKR